MEGVIAARDTAITRLRSGSFSGDQAHYSINHANVSFVHKQISSNEAMTNFV